MSLLSLPESDRNLDSISLRVNQSPLLSARILEKVLFSTENIEIALELSRCPQFYISLRVQSTKQPSSSPSEILYIV